MSQWLIIHTPDGPRCWPLGDPDPAHRDQLVLAARALAAVPHGDGWVSQPELGYDILVTFGRPHPKLMDRSLCGTVEELEAHAATAGVAEYAAEHQRQRDVAKVAAAEAMLATLDDAAVEELLARRSQTSEARKAGASHGALG